jgi:hypothetical protein
LIVRIALSKLPHWGLILGITFLLLLTVGLNLIIAYCSKTNEVWGVVIYINSNPQSKAEVLDISNSEEECGLRKPLVNLLYSSILLAKLLELPM